MTNGYFQVTMSDDNIGIDFYPPTDGGENLKIEEVLKYLEKMKVMDYDLVSLNLAFKKGQTEKAHADILTRKMFPIRETMLVKVVKEDMFAVARFYPPSTNGQRMSKEEILKDLEYQGITFGISEKTIDEIISNPLYCYNYVIAKGKLPVQGTNAEIKYHFNTDRRLKPKRNEDGSVDFHQLDSISHIKKGDVLATLTPAYAGEPGTTVRGAVARPRTVKHLTFKYGLNISVSEDGCSLISDVNGHATLEGEKVFVSNVYDVPADVDNSTGDIKYEGNVLVHGTVKTGFKIEATGDVEVLGAVEGATIISGGQIILHHGMQGMSRGVLKAEGNIVAKFIESSSVNAGGYVEADTIIQSNVSAKGDVNVNGTKGFIIGGTVRSASMVAARTIGSNMGISTVIEVGVDPVIKEKFVQNGEELKKKEAELRQVAAVVDMMKKKQAAGNLDKSKLPMYVKSIQQLKDINDEISKINSEMEEIVEQMNINNNACVKVSHTVYPGVRIIISEEHMAVNQELIRCKFICDKGR